MPGESAAAGLCTAARGCPSLGTMNHVVLEYPSIKMNGYCQFLTDVPQTIPLSDSPLPPVDVHEGRRQMAD